jgi:hypothetical protein
MTDRFVAGAMMAGHHNNVSPLGLRNLPFMMFVSEEDSKYDRNTVTAEWGDELAELRERDEWAVLEPPQILY